MLRRRLRPLFTASYEFDNLGHSHCHLMCGCCLAAESRRSQQWRDLPSFEFDNSLSTSAFLGSLPLTVVYAYFKYTRQACSCLAPIATWPRSALTALVPLRAHSSLLASILQSSRTVFGWSNDVRRTPSTADGL